MLDNYVGFQVSGVSPAAGRQSGQSNLKRNSSPTNVECRLIRRRRIELRNSACREPLCRTARRELLGRTARRELLGRTARRELLGRTARRELLGRTVYFIC